MRIKFRILDQQKQVIYSGSNRWFADFWDTFLGWIVSLPNTYRFQNGTVLQRKLSSMKIVFDGKSGDHHFHALVNNPSLSRGGKKRPSHVQIDNDSYEKIFAMKKNHHQRDTFTAVFEEDKLDNETAAMVMIALADSI